MIRIALPTFLLILLISTSVYSQDNIAINSCGLKGTLSERIKECKNKMPSELIEEYTSKNYYVYTVNKEGKVFIADKEFKYGWSYPVQDKDECIKPYKSVWKYRIKRLKSDGIKTPEGMTRCRIRLDRYVLLPKSRKERFND